MKGWKLAAKSFDEISRLGESRVTVSPRPVGYREDKKPTFSEENKELLREVHAEISKGSKIPFFKLLGMKLKAKKAKELKAKLGKAIKKKMLAAKMDRLSLKNETMKDAKKGNETSVFKLAEAKKRLNDTISSH